MGKLMVVVGGQFGSEAKGHVAADLARREINEGRRVTAVRVAGPNAGHTAYDRKGVAWALRCIPVMAVVDPDIKLVLAAGSEIDLDVLRDEMVALAAGGHAVANRLWIDDQATVLTQSHIVEETQSHMHELLGSTGKGVGAARADRLMRRAQTWGELPSSRRNGLAAWDTAAEIHDDLAGGNTVIIEGTQGYGLGLHAGYYPYCTSSDCRAIDFCAMAGVNPWDPVVDRFEAWVVCRTMPIRVAGNSGPLNNETTWEFLEKHSGGHIKPERTTVTKKIRRIGGWDMDLAQAAVRANGGPPTVKLAITFLDYVDPTLADTTDISDLANEVLLDIENELGCPVDYISTGPNTGWFT